MYPGHYAKTQPDAIAVVRPSTGERLTYLELDQRSNRLAQVFYKQGLRRGDHVAVFLENSMIYFDALWACLRSGLYLTPINRYLPATEAAYIVDNCDALALVASAMLDRSAELGRLTPRCELKLAVGGPIDGFADYEATLASAPAERLAEESLGSFMLYSSGTTGKPKGVRRPLPEGDPTQGDPALTTPSRRYGFDPSTIYLSPAPLYHGAPIGYVTRVQYAGGTVVMMDRFDPELSLELIERHRVTHSQWVPTMFIRMLKLPDEARTRWDLSSHRCAIHAAAPCPMDVKQQMIEWWGPIIEEYFSSTEGIAHTMISSAEWLDHPGSVGKPRAPTLHICDEEGRELPTGTAGQIYGEVSMARFCYHKDEVQTVGSTHPTKSNWMTTGDIGYLDNDGYLYLTDRKAFMIISGGVNIYPQQIEDAIALHPRVADVAVIGVPHPDLGEEVKAVVQLEPGEEPSDELAQELMEFIRDKLGRQLTPRSIDFTPSLPRLPTGKLYKKALRDQYWGEAGSSKILAR